MTLLTAEGLIRASNRWHERGLCDPIGVMHRAYLRWLRTQGKRSAYPQSDLAEEMPGWLIHVRGLHSQRAPGLSCLSALQSGAERSIESSINNSKGCGGVMRVAPAGLAFSDYEEAFEFGCKIAAITHGHPTGYLSAGFLAALITMLFSGENLQTAIESTLDLTKTKDCSEETYTAISKALDLACKGKLPPEDIEKNLGYGWIAEEALSISIYTSLVARSFEEGVILAVNHSGDSDSTGAITGNILGTILGQESIPNKWLAELELHDEIVLIATDIFQQFQKEDFLPIDKDFAKYPPS